MRTGEPVAAGIPLAAPDQQRAANAPLQTAYAVAGVAAVVLIFVGLLLSQYMPPPKADWSAEHIQVFYQSHTALKRVGIFLLLFGTTLFAVLVAGMKVVLGRIEGPGRPLGLLQAIIGAAGTALLMLFAMILAVAAFRPERSPEITQALHDLGWFMAFISAVPFTLQAVAIAVAILTNRETVLPRWFGYLNISVAVLLLPGAALLFFKTGPLAYHGILSYWIPVFDFGIWMLAMAWAIRRSALTPDSSISAAA
ncbi:MAG: hypothetical protein WAW17_14970 [Rhodococcus sp. (in: high G+C Gram-positive bacteria)]|uniref:hypothetical protein n=1 Tax=Rhodococcus sp. TaxID=1831 RepID=UPI003BAFEC0A